MGNIIEITNFNVPELDVYARISEVQLLRYLIRSQVFLLRKVQR